MVKKTLAQWFTWIEQQHVLEIDLSLERVLQIAEKLGLLKFNCPVITVGGTNGKGSTVTTLAAIYSAAGYRCGVYTSPHLLQFNERIVMDNHMVSDAALCEAFAAVEAVRDTITLTYFEFATLAALYLFQKNTVEIIILEVGLGGRLDAVNIVDSDVAILTTVDIDHTDYLGNSREEIGAEKAGIFRTGKPAIYGDCDRVSTVIENAAAKGAVLYLQGTDFYFEEEKETWHWHNTDRHYTHLPKPAVLLHNASLALQAVTLLESRLPVTLEAIRQGLATVRVVGRFQILADKPRCIVDVAHNPQSSAQLYRQLNLLGWQGKLHIVFSMLATKDRLASLLPWQQCDAKWYLAPLTDKKAAPLEAIVAAFNELGITSYQKYDTIDNAYSAARDNAAANETVLVFGSFHTVAEVIRNESIDNYSPAMK
ncbi:MAG: folC [Gammaproteobacteria bacterium]|jgi:dihydrofolate synthase/folylpolyglutamate synthase|nr:folC [Gammaproteobacteria bacterium]